MTQDSPQGRCTIWSTSPGALKSYCGKISPPPLWEDVWGEKCDHPCRKVIGRVRTHFYQQISMTFPWLLWQFPWPNFTLFYNKNKNLFKFYCLLFCFSTSWNCARCEGPCSPKFRTQKRIQRFLTRCVRTFTPHREHITIIYLTQLNAGPEFRFAIYIYIYIYIYI